MSDKKFDPTALLSMPVSDIHPPAKMPLGSYVAVAPDYEFDKTKPQGDKDPTDLVKIKVVLVEAFPDVDQDALKEVLEQEKGDLKDIEQRPMDYFITPKALFRLKELIYEHAKVSEEDAPSLTEGLEILKSGKQFGVEIVAVKNAKDPKNPYHQIGRTFALPE